MLRWALTIQYEYVACIWLVYTTILARACQISMVAGWMLSDLWILYSILDTLVYLVDTHFRLDNKREKTEGKCSQYWQLQHKDTEKSYEM